MAGAGYKLFATGDVLTAAQVNTYLMQQTVMVFASSVARTSALSGVLAEGMVSYLQDTNTLEVYDGAAWIGATGDITALTAGTGISITNPTGPVPTVAIDTAVTANLTTAQTLTNKTLTSPVLTTPSISNINAKGDILVGTADNTLGIITAGSNGETLVADSSTSTGLRYQGSQPAGKNIIINGNFDIWQRGTSFVGATTGSFTADRWIVQNSGTSPTVSQQSTGAPVGGRYVVRVASTASGSYCNLGQLIETSNTEVLWGQTVVVSVKLRRNASYASTLTVYLQKSATVDAGTGATWTTVSSTTVSNANLPTGTGATDWYLSSLTTTIPQDGTANSVRVLVTQDTTATASGQYWEMAQFQLELGSVATTFARTGGTIQGELSAAQRYYFRTTTGTNNQLIGAGIATTATTASVYVVPPVTMRVAPTSVDAANLATSDLTAFTNAVTAPTTIGISTPNNVRIDLAGGSGMTAKTPIVLQTNGTAGYLGLSAEL